MPTTWYNGKVIKIEDESSTTKRFWLEVGEVDHFDFKAGQFITMDLPVSKKRNERWRSYSIANAPEGTNILELCIVLLEGGVATTYLFNEINIGDEIKFKGPSGTFVLPEKINKKLVLICTGTGVAPFRAMINDVYNQNKPHRGIHLIFGTRKEEGILYRRELEAFQERHTDFEYSIALSREENWSGPKGYVHQIFESAYKDIDPNIVFYICGWSNMIDDAVAKLIVEMGYDKSQIHYELYG